MVQEQWSSDITYIRTHEGWSYLAVVIDLFSRRIVGWSMQSRMTTDLALQALLSAVWRRKPKTIIQTLNDKGVSITFKSENLTFSASSDDAFAKLHLQMMGAFAEFERNIIRKRQAEGIAMAKAKGLYNGRPKTVDDDKVRALKEAGMGATAIAKELGLVELRSTRL